MCNREEFSRKHRPEADEQEPARRGQQVWGALGDEGESTNRLFLSGGAGLPPAKQKGACHAAAHEGGLLKPKCKYKCG